MIPLWIISLLGTTDVEEFSYNNGYRISIRGKLVGGEWMVDVYVNAIPYFAWGCNKFYTGMRGSFNSVVRYYLTLVINRLSEYNVEGRKELLSIMKGYLE
nr:MAG TPA: hypothetical protein [Caudoviricetes sp.]